jgi:hypothetical protein
MSAIDRADDWWQARLAEGAALIGLGGLGLVAGACLWLWGIGWWLAAAGAGMVLAGGLWAAWGLVARAWCRRTK